MKKEKYIDKWGVIWYVTMNKWDRVLKCWSREWGCGVWDNGRGLTLIRL